MDLLRFWLRSFQSEGALLHILIHIELVSGNQIVIPRQTEPKVFVIAPLLTRSGGLALLQVSILVWLRSIFCPRVLLTCEKRLQLLRFLKLWELGIGSTFILVRSLAIEVTTALLAHILLKWRLGVLKVYPRPAWVLYQPLTLPGWLAVQVSSTLKTIS